MSQTDQKSSRGLGRGIEALLPQDFDKSLLVEKTERIEKIAVTALGPQENQPRKHFDGEAIKQLSDSIKAHGILQPLIVTPIDVAQGSYTIIAGERRWRAAQKAGLKTVPVIIRSAKELEKIEIALVENVQRVDLSPLEQAASIERLHQLFNQDYKDIGQRLGKNESTIINIVRLLQLPPEAIQALQEEKITSGHARSILALKSSPEKQQELLDSILKYGWSVRQAERFVVAYKKQGADSEKAQASVKTETNETRLLSKRINAPVTIRRMANGGKLEIGFQSEEDLSRIIKIFDDL